MMSKAIVTSELAAMATTDGGGGATVIPATVKTRMRTDSAASQNFFATDRLAPDKKSEVVPVVRTEELIS
jgi:hypothetical protein